MIVRMRWGWGCHGAWLLQRSVRKFPFALTHWCRHVLTLHVLYSELRYVQETLFTFPLILFALCSLCMRVTMRMIRFECLRHAGCIFMAHLLSRQWVSFPAKPLDLMQWSNYQTNLHCFAKLSVACVVAVNFEVYTLTISAYKSTPLSYDRN